MCARVLVVDNSPARVHEVRDRLTSMGCSVAVAESAHSALSLLSSGMYDMVVVNWFIEDMMLHDFAETAKRSGSDCLLMVTFDRKERFRPRGLDDPYVDGWVPYNCSEQTLRGLVDRASGTGARMLA